MSQRNVHVYDGHLKHVFEQERPYPVEEKVAAFHALLEEKKIIGLKARMNLRKIISGMNDDGNKQPINGLDASDVLMDLLKRGTGDFFAALNEQLSDMSSGSCPSGRCTRLLQVWAAHVVIEASRPPTSVVVGGKRVVVHAYSTRVKTDAIDEALQGRIIDQLKARMTARKLASLMRKGDKKVRTDVLVDLLKRGAGVGIKPDMNAALSKGLEKVYQDLLQVHAKYVPSPHAVIKAESKPVLDKPVMIDPIRRVMRKPGRSAPAKAPQRGSAPRRASSGVRVRVTRVRSGGNRISFTSRR